MGGLVLASGAASLAIVGCGGDDTVVGLDSGQDATNPDTGIDVSSPPPDTGSDTAPPADGGSDAADGADANLPDVTPAPFVGDFPDQVLTALCTSIGRCCAFYPDAGAFDQNRCISGQNAAGGFKYLSYHKPSLQDAGALVTYDLAKAGKCLQDLATFTCPPPAQTALEYQTARDDCYAALKGKILLNATGCSDDIHCAAGHCVGGTCVALTGDGGTCQVSDECAYRGSSVPSLFCNNDGTADGGICVPRLDVDASCGNYNDFDYAACGTGICDSTSGLCVNSEQFIDVATCAVFSLKDAGPG